MAAEQPVTAVLWRGPVEDGPVPAEQFIVAQQPLQAALSDGAVRLQLLYLSVDPYMRGRMRSMKSYYFVGPFEPQQPLSGLGVARVEASNCSKFAVGDVVVGFLPWCTHCIVAEPTQGPGQLSKVDPALLGRVPTSYFLSVLGMPGMTAYAGLKRIAEPKAGDVAFVSGAAGAVGLVVVQLLKLQGCKVIGSAGSDDKVALLKELDVDCAFNYKTQSTVDLLAEAAPKGIDIYWDNVGGAVLEAALDAASLHARFVMCGAISQYDTPEAGRHGVKNLFQVIVKRLKLQGFIVGDYQAELGAAFAAEMGQLVTAGKLVMREQLSEGIERAGAAFVDMMAGGNTGKAVVRVAPDPFPVRGKDA